MIKLCPSCATKYESPQGIQHLLNIKQMKQNLYCIHTFTKAKLENQ